MFSDKKKDMENGPSSNVNFIVGSDGVDSELEMQNERDEIGDEFPQNGELTANSSFSNINNIFGLGERKRRLR